VLVGRRVVQRLTLFCFVSRLSGGARWMRTDKATSIVSVYAYRPLGMAAEPARVNRTDRVIADAPMTRLRQVR
jgi:hypothetical protein